MKKLIKKYWKIMVVIVILGIFVLLFFLVRYKGKKNLEANIAAEQQDVFGIKKDLIRDQQHINTEKIS